MIDTAEKRRMALDFGKWCGTGMPIPQGMTSVSERAHILNVYYETPTPATLFFWRNKNRVGSSWTSKIVPTSIWTKKTAPSTTWVGKNTPPDGSTQTL